MDKNSISRLGHLENTIGIFIIFGIMIALMNAGMINRYHQGIIIVIFINIILATSLNFITGCLGELALGHAGFMAIGAYTASFVTLNMNLGLPGTVQLIISLLLGGLLAGIFGIIIGIPVLRLEGDYLAITTLGFGEMIRVAIFNLDFLGGARGIFGIPRLTNFNVIFWITVIIIFVLFRIIRSRHGRAILAIRENVIAAESVGIPTVFYKIFTFAISAFIAGVGGGLLAHYLTIIDPKTFNFAYSIDILIFVVLGGMGSFTGAVIGAIILTIMPEFLRVGGIQEYRFLIKAILLIILMIFRPKGILGRAEFSLVQTLEFIKCKIFKNAKKPT
ncbi:MAG: branched-chain amino acid ABC transporter permease [Peptostreptococcales bacterium]